MIPEAKNLVFNEYYDGKLVEIHLVGSLQKDDYRALLPWLGRLMQKRDHIRMLLQLHHFHGWAAGIVWNELNLKSLSPLRRVERLAVVGDEGGKTDLHLFTDPFRLARLQFFPTERAREARQWVDEGLTTSET